MAVGRDLVAAQCTQDPTRMATAATAQDAAADATLVGLGPTTGFFFVFCDSFLETDIVHASGTMPVSGK